MEPSVTPGPAPTTRTGPGSPPPLPPSSTARTAPQIQRTPATSDPDPTYDPPSSRVRSLPLQRLFSGAAPPTNPLALPVRQAEAAAEPVATSPELEPTRDTQQWEPPRVGLQRSEAKGAESAAPEPSTPAATTTGVTAAASTTPAPAPGKPGGPDLDELARRLYAPMSALLRAELWLDRERSGRSMTR